MTLYSDEELDILSKRIIYRSQTFDPATRLPLVVMNSAAFPKAPEDYTSELMSKLISLLPADPYVLVFFACGAPNKPSWSWISNIYNMIDRQVKKRVGKVYVVHESWWVRAVTEMFRGIVSNKFKRKIIHVPNLSQLAKNIDITLINIPPEIYIFNLKNESTITIPRHHLPIFGVPLRTEGHRAIYPLMWKQCIDYLQVTAQATKNVFQQEESQNLLYILRDCYDRGQLLDLDDYGPHVTASVVKLYLQELPNPLIPIKYIPLPIKDTAEYSCQVFLSLPETTQKLFKDLIPIAIAVVDNQSRTNQSLRSISSNLAPCFIGRYASSKENLAIAVRFTRNLIEYWPNVTRQLDSDSDSSSSDEEDSVVTSRKSSYDRSTKPVSISSTQRSSYETLNGAFSKSILTSFASRNSSTTSLSSIQSHNSSPALGSKVTDSTGRIKSKSDDCLPDSLKSTASPSSSSSSLSSSSLPPPPPPPVPPPLRKSASTAFRSDFSSPSIGLHARKSMSNLDDQPSSLKSVTVSTKRGKMVAELAKLYEIREDSNLNIKQNS